MLEKLASILGANVLDSVKDIVQTFKLPPEQQLQFDQKMAELKANTDAKLAEVAAQDRNSAREREIQVKDNTPRILAFVIVGGFLGMSFGQFAALYIFHDVKLPSEAWVMVGNLSGYMAAKSELALAYYFGTSSGSDKKTDMLERMSQK